MILILTCEEDSTADYLCNRLRQNDVVHLRFNTDRPLDSWRVRYSSGEPRLVVGSSELKVSEVDHLWFRRPKPLTVEIGDTAERTHIARELSECLEGYFAHIPIERWINHPARNSLASHKLEQLSRASSLGLLVPPTLLTQDPDELRCFWETHQQRIVVKPISGGYLERSNPSDDTQIYTNLLAIENLTDPSLRACPTLFQSCVTKRVDVRITIVDANITAVAMSAIDAGKQRVDIRRNNMLDVNYTRIELPDQVAAQLLSLTRSYELRFAAIDMAVDEDDRWWFFEVNPNGQWAWLDLSGAVDIYKSFVSAFR